MPRSPSTFPSSSAQYIPSTTITVPGTILPKNTFLDGQLVVLFPLKGQTPDQLRIRIKNEYSQSTLASDYVAPSPASSRKVKWKFTITLIPTENVKNSWTSTEEAMRQEYSQMEGLLGHELKLVTDSMRITNVEGREVNIEATGARMVWTETKGAWTIFQANTQSTAPSWLESPDLPSPPSSSNIDAPTRYIARPPPPPLPTNLRPITSHIPVKVGIRPMEAAFIAAAQKRKRSESPSKSLAEASTSAMHVDKRHVVSLGSSVRPSGFPSRFPTSVGREHAAAHIPPASVQQHPAAMVPGPSREVPSVPAKGNDSTHSAAVVYRLNPIAHSAQHPQHTTFVSRAISVPPIEFTPVASPPRSISPSKSASNPRAEAEAKARSAAARRHAFQLVAEEEARAKADALVSDLSAGLVLPGIRYTTVKETRAGPGNIMGIVLEASQPKQLKEDCMTTIVITDPTTYTGDSTGEDMVICLFRKDRSELPKDLVHGAPILFRNLKFSWFKGKVKGQAYSKPSERSCWDYVLGDFGDTPEEIKNLAEAHPMLCAEELGRLKALKKWWVDSGNLMTDGGPVVAGAPVAMSRAISSGSGQGGKARLRTLGDFVYGKFGDVIVKIVHMSSGSRAWRELYVVDGTVSRLPLRNYHNVEHPHVPINGVFKIDIMDPPLEADLATFAIGNMVILQNIHAKEYMGALEMKWADKVTDEQASAGWENRRPILISPADERALAVEARINEHRTGGRAGNAASPALKQESPSKPFTSHHTKHSSLSPGKPRLSSEAVSSAHTTEPNAASVQQPRPPIRLATHVFTTHTDPIEHQTQTISEILANATFPNKFRVKARVTSVHSRGIKGNDTFVQKHCGHCKRAIVKKHHCESCNDIKLTKASWRYHFIAILEDEDASMPILISDEEAARFVPALPPCSPSDNPNDIRKTNRQIAETSKGVLDVLQGAPLDRIRPLPYIDWSLMSCIVPAPKGYGGVGGCKGVAVYKAFGMEGK